MELEYKQTITLTPHQVKAILAEQIGSVFDLNVKASDVRLVIKNSLVGHQMNEHYEASFTEAIIEVGTKGKTNV